MEQRVFTFLEAPLGAQVTYVLTGDQLEKRDAEGVPDWQIALTDVKVATYGMTKIHGLIERSLALETADKTVRVRFTSRHPTDDDPQGFAPLIHAIGTSLDKAKSGFRVALGQTPFQRYALFSAFALAIVIAAGILIAMVLSSMGFNDLLPVAAPLGILIAFGGLGMRMFWPWRPLPTIAAKRLLAPPPQSDITPI